jgi:pullulanase
MVKKYIVDSVNYWADEYHIDGFRFDLVGLLDTETVNEIVETVHESHPDVIFYGEGWTLSTSVTKVGYDLATQTNSAETPGFAYFNDTIRDGLKGNVFNNNETGYVSGAQNMESTIISSFLGNVSWCSSPSQTINYASCHDNLTLYDRLQVSRSDASEEDLIKMNNLAASIYMLSEGVPFMQAGEEILRSKPNGDGTYDSNSYSSGDEINSIKWSTLDDEQYMNVFEYYKGLIAFRKAHGALRLSDAADVAEHVQSVEGLDANVVAFDITGGINDETADEIYVIYNANEEETTVSLPDGDWNVYINGEKAGTEILETVKEGSVTVSPISAMVLVRESASAIAGSDGSASSSSASGKVAAGVVALVVVIAAAAGITVSKRKKKA